MVLTTSFSVHFRGVLSVKHSWSKIKSPSFILRRISRDNLVYLVFPGNYASTKLLVVTSESHTVGFLVFLVINP